MKWVNVMDDLLLIDWQMRSLAAAGEREDWQAIQKLDADIAAMLTRLHGAVLSEKKRQALEALQQVHGRVHLRVRTQRDELSKQLEQQRNQREGAISYAVFTEEDRVSHG